MYLKTDKLVVTIKDTVFRSYKTGTGGQFVLDPTAITGWNDGADARRDTTVRPVSSGDFSEPYTFSSRLISLTGIAIAPSRQELQVLRDKLIGLFSPSEYATISVQTSVDTRYATVGLEGSVSWIQQADKFASFKIDLYAPDPHVYGVEKRAQAGAYVVSGGLRYRLTYPLNYHYSEQAVNRTVTNNGNATAYPLFVAVGDFYSGFSVMTGFGGRKVTYTGMVTTSAPVTIDMARGTATQNGVDKTVLVTKREWFGIPPKSTIFPVFDPLAGNSQAGSGRCDIIYRDTWI
jgi:hypothetical protein